MDNIQQPVQVSQPTIPPTPVPPVSEKRNRNLPMIIAGTIIVLFLLVGSYILGQQSGKQKIMTVVTPTVVPTEIPSPVITKEIPTVTPGTTTTATQVTQEFYDNYNTCIKNSDSNGQNNNGKSRIEICGEKYKLSLSSSFYTYLKTFYDKPYDPILCSQAYYDAFRIKDVDTNVGYSKVIVLTQKDQAQSPSWFVYLIKSNNQWVINEVQCPKY
jgi:hypothetical protein